MNPKFRTTAFGMLITAILASLANAEDATTDPIASYLGNDTAVVGWVDVNEVDLPGFQAFAEKYDIQTGPLDRAIQFQKALKTVGVKRAFALGTVADMSQGGPLVVLPSTSEQVETVHLVVTTMVPKEVTRVAIHGDNVLIGAQQLIDRYTAERQKKPHPALVAAVNEVKLPNAVVIRIPATAVVFLSPVIPELMESLRLTETTDQDAVQAMAMAIQTVSFAASIPPTQADLKVKMLSKETAESLGDIVNLGMEEFEQTESLEVKVEGETAQLSLPNKQAVEAGMNGLMELLSPARASAQQSQRMNSLKQIGLAMHNYYEAYRSLPPQALASKDGRKLLSWRVLILPFLGQNELYQKFKLDESWDSEHNLKLVEQIPFVYSGQLPRDGKPSGKTRLQTPLRSDSVFGRTGVATTFRDITDGTSNTLMVVEVPESKAVIWTKPDDIAAEDMVDASLFTADGEDGFLAGFCDGSVRKITASVAAKTLTALLTMNGGEVIDYDEL